MAKRSTRRSRTKPSAEQRFDSFQNVLLGLGTPDDRMFYSRPGLELELSDDEIWSMLRNSPEAFRICDMPALDMTRRGFEVKVDTETDDDESGTDDPSTRGDADDDDGGDDDDDDDDDDERAPSGLRTPEQERSTAEANRIAKALDKGLQRLQFLQRLREGIRAGRAWGGAIGFFGCVERGYALKSTDRWREPLDTDRLERIGWIKIYDRRFLEAGPIEDDPETPWFGTPRHYRLRHSTHGIVLHASRCVLFRGAPGTDGARVGVGGWQNRALMNAAEVEWRWWDTALQRPYEAVRDFQIAYGGAARSMTELGVMKFKMKDLAHKIKLGNEDEVIRRVHLLQQGKHIGRVALIDADTEDLEYIERAQTGIADVLDRMGIRMSSSTGIPQTRMLGISPGGFGTGESEDRNYDDMIAAMQIEDAQPAAERAIDLLLYCKEGPTGGRYMPYSIEWRPLRAPSDSEKAELRMLVAQYAALLIQSGVITEDEAALSLFGKEQFSMDIVLDLERRRKEAAELNGTTEAVEKRAAELVAKMRAKSKPGGPGGPGNDPGSEDLAA